MGGLLVLFRMALRMCVLLVAPSIFVYLYSIGRPALLWCKNATNGLTGA